MIMIDNDDSGVDMMIMVRIQQPQSGVKTLSADLVEKCHFDSGKQLC